MVDGLPLFHRLAVDTTLVSLVRGTRAPRRVQTTTDQLGNTHDERGERPTWSTHEAGRAWWCWDAKLEERRSEEARNFESQLAQAKSRRELRQFRQPMRHACFRCWSTSLACSAARSFALSLLESRRGLGWMETRRLPRLCSRSSDRSVGTVEPATRVRPPS